MRVSLAIALGFVVACGNLDRDPHSRVSSNYEGRLEADLLREIGPPTRSRSLSTPLDRLLCGSRSGEATRELSYDIPSRGVAKWLYDTLGLSPSTTIVCVDGTGRITAVSIVVS
jgi:hypothetical protein